MRSARQRRQPVHHALLRPAQPFATLSTHRARRHRQAPPECKKSKCFILYSIGKEVSISIWWKLLSDLHHLWVAQECAPAARVHAARRPLRQDQSQRRLIGAALIIHSTQTTSSTWCAAYKCRVDSASGIRTTYENFQLRLKVYVLVLFDDGLIVQLLA